MPKLFKHSGKIRNKHLSKRDTEKLVKEIWKERMADPGGWVGACPPACLPVIRGAAPLYCRCLLGLQLTDVHDGPSLCCLQQRVRARRATCWSLSSSSCRRKWALSLQWWR